MGYATARRLDCGFEERSSVPMVEEEREKGGVERVTWAEIGIAL